MQDIEANKEEEPEQAIEQYKQSIEEFYESFNQLNIQFYRSKKQELQKQSRIAILGQDQSFGINEIAQNIPKRLTTAICTSIRAEVFILEKQVYFNGIKDKQIYEDFIKENQLKQTWRKQQVENSKNLFQKFEYRKYNIQTNKSVKQIKGFFDITVDNSKQNASMNQNKESNSQQLINSARQSSSIQSARQLISVQSARHHNLGQKSKQTTEESMFQSSPKDSEISIKLKGLSLHKTESAPKNNLNNKEIAKNKGQLYQDKQSLSMRLGSNEQNKLQKENNYFQSQRISIMKKKSNYQTNQPTFNFKNLNFTQLQEQNKDFSLISSQISPKQNQTMNVKSQRNILTSILKSSMIDNFKNQINQQSSDYNENASTHENSNNNQPIKQLTLLQKLAETPKSFYEEELFNKLSININENTQKKKRKYAQKQNTFSLNTDSNKTILASKSINEKDQLKLLVPLYEKNIEYNNQVNNDEEISYSNRRRKKSQEDIRSFKIDSQQEIERMFQNKGETDRFQQLDEVEIQMIEQFGRQLANASLVGTQQNNDPIQSSKSLKCFEKTYSDAQAVMKKRSFLDSLSQKQYFNQIRKSLNINRDQKIVDQIVKRASIENSPTVPVYQRIQSAQSSRFTPVSKSQAKNSVFFPSSRQSINTKPNYLLQSPLQVYTQEVQNQAEQNEQNKYILNQNEKKQINEFNDLEITQSVQINNFCETNFDQTEQTKFNNEEVISQFNHNIEISLNQDYQNEIKLPKEPSLSSFGQKSSSSNRFTQTNIYKANFDVYDLRSTLNDEILNEFDNQTTQLNQSKSKQHIKIPLKSPQGSSGRISSLCSLKNEDIQQQDQNQLLLLNKKKQNSKPYVVDYNFIDSAKVSKYQINKQPRNIPYESKQTSQQAFSTVNLQIQEQTSPLKYKKVLQIECEDIPSVKIPIQQLQQQENINLTLSQTNQSTSHTVGKQSKQDYFKAQTPQNNGINQFDNNEYYQSSNGPFPIVRLKSKSSSAQSRQKFFKKEEINSNIKQNNKFNSIQKQFLYQLLNRNSMRNQNQDISQNLSTSVQQQQKNLSQSYYRTTVNKQVHCAYSSPRQLVFKYSNKQTNNTITNNQGKVNYSFDKKNQNLQNQSTNN